MFSVQSSASSISDYVVSFECELNTSDGTSNSFWYKQVFYAVLPFTLLFVNVLFWGTGRFIQRMHCCQRKGKHRRKKKRSTLLDNPAIQKQVKSELLLFAKQQVSVGNGENKSIFAGAQDAVRSKKMEERQAMRTAIRSRRSGDGSSVMLIRKLMTFLHDKEIDLHDLINQNADDELKNNEDALINHYITQEHLVCALERCNVPFSREELFQIATHLDKDRDDQITVHEIVSYHRTVWDKIVLSSSIIMFIVYPSVCKQVFQLLACRGNLDPSSDNGTPSQRTYILTELQVQCYDEQHAIYILLVGLPTLVLYVFGFPLISLLVLKRHKGKVLSDEVLYRYSMFLNGYREEYLFWECIISLRKALLTFVSVFFAQMGVFTQVYAAIFTLFIFLILQARASPYATESLNELESGALYTSFLSLYIGLLLYMDVSDDTVKSTLPFILLFLNIGFVCWAVSIVAKKFLPALIVKFKESCFKGWGNKRDRPKRTKIKPQNPSEKANEKTNPKDFWE